MRESRIPIAGPWITEHEVQTVAEAARTAWQSDAEVYHRRFERAFADYIGRRSALALPSCTSAIHLSLAALGIGPGDEVVVPEITWIASAAPITYVGAEPVFADIDPATWCLCPRSFERAITSRTRAVVIVDLYGNVADMRALLDVAARHDVAVIEDAAQAIGSEQHGRRAGSFGRVGVFSFHGSKTLTTGEGGMLVTDDEDLYRRCLVLRDHGRAPGDHWFCNDEVAFKYRMSSMQAAMGLAQLRRIDELVRRKREVFQWYDDRLAGHPHLRLNPCSPGTKPTSWMVTALIDPALGVTKRSLMEHMDRDGIATRPFFHPLSTLPAYAGTASARGAAARNPHAHRLAPYGVNLPSGLRLTGRHVQRVCDSLMRFLDAARRNADPILAATS